MTRLWLLRHGPVECAEGLCYGASDVKASEPAMQEIAERAAAQLPPGVDFHASPLARCAQLAFALEARRPDLKAQFDTRIAEMSFGRWEGSPWNDIPRAEFDGWLQDFAAAPAGGSGESTNAFMGRVGDAYDAWQASGQDAAWVTHAGVMRAVLLLHQGLRKVDRADQWPVRTIGLGELMLIEAA
ncbi:histidine phosphatase family protein [Variovorax sp. OV329]|uniref:histidine phosphatase family protein n=1 Tax=Variovorax sp. OV329 TaxID=1882825 RepID=UPI0008E4C623|nr:histidine phosphatase family protein [Variovorax sp. OV329]SFM46236.1 alpha-ribazole phosphatase [Variovorax sp. OV329]